MKNIDRRTALAVTGTALAATLTGIARSVAAPGMDRSLAKLETLIGDYAEAEQVSSEKWDTVSDIEDSEPMECCPIVRVQIGRLLGARDDDGNNTWTPIYAYDEEGIESYFRGHFDAQSATWGTNEIAKQRLSESYAAKIAEKKAELHVLRAEAARKEEACGFTAALAAARSADACSADIVANIIALVPGSLEAAGRKAAWVATAYKENSLAEEDVLEAMGQIGKAVST